MTPKGGAGRSLQIVSIGLTSTPISSACAFLHAEANLDTESGVLKARVVPEPVARPQVSPNPIGRRSIDCMSQFEKGSVHLQFRLLGVTPVDKQRRSVLQYNRDSRRSREACQPQQPLGVCRNVLILMFVRPRNDKSLYAELLEFSAQFGQPPFAISWAAQFRKRLKSTFKHGKRSQFAERPRSQRTRPTESRRSGIRATLGSLVCHKGRLRPKEVQFRHCSGHSRVGKQKVAELDCKLLILWLIRRSGGPALLRGRRLAGNGSRTWRTRFDRGERWRWRKDCFGRLRFRRP